MKSRFIHKLLVALACLGAFDAFAQGETDKDKSAEAIKAVIEAFRAAIINKDKPAFAKLFLAESIPWLAVMDDESLKRIRLKHPKAAKVDIKANDTYSLFINEVVANSEPSEEKFSDINIHTDGNIASVYFEYSFHIGDYKSNWGHENWQLVNTGNGWKIHSVVYSVIVNPVPRPKIKK